VRVIKQDKKFKGRFIRVLKKVGLVLLVIFIVFNALPYLLPLKPLAGDPAELLFEDSEFVTVNGLELHYRQWAKGPAEEGNVLLIHGFSGSTFSWRYSAPVLEAEGYRVIAVDLPGFGLSERSSQFTPTAKERAKLVWSLLETIEPGVKWNLAGHSMGGSVVTAMALQRPEQVKSLVLAAGAIPGSMGRRQTWYFRYSPVARTIRHLATRVLLTEDNVLKALTSAYGRAPNPEEFEGYYRPLLIRDTDAALVSMLQAREEPFFDQLKDIELPTLLIWGEDDAWVPLAEGQKLLAA
jgi:2-hydroxy-6-oxonona-2,4-dienedioate hydrolase